nr:TPA_inf: MLH3 [Sporisorium graminicola]
MDAITRLPDGTAASIQASLFAVTIEDICRILFRHALGHCRDVFGSSSGRTDISVDYDLWIVTVTIDVDHSSIRSVPFLGDQATSGKHSELKLVSHLGLTRIEASSSSGRSSTTWQDGLQLQSKSSSAEIEELLASLSSAAVSGRGVTVCMCDVFSGMPVRRKLIASEADKRSRVSSLVSCARGLSLLSPDSSIRLSVRQAAVPDRLAPPFKVLLSLPREQDLVHRYTSAFGVDIVQLQAVRIVAVEQTFASARMSVNGFVAATATTDTASCVFLQQRVWPGATMCGGSQPSERESAVFASLLSSFHLPWSDETSNRYTRRLALCPDFYEKVYQRIEALPTVSAPDKGRQTAQAFVLDITLHDKGREEHAPGLELTVASFEAAVLDAICKVPEGVDAVLHVKRKRSSRRSTAGERGSKEKSARRIKPCPATASLAIESYGPAALAPEGMVEWRNPVTGRLFHIDQRTGHSVAVRPGSGNSGDEDMPSLTMARRANCGTGVDRSNLNKGLDGLPPGHRLAAAFNRHASVDEFDDPSLDEALASIPSPSPISASEPFRRSRFFDSMRPRSPYKRIRSQRLQNDASDDYNTLPRRANLELAITRSDLKRAQVLDQVDEKFILCSTSSSALPSTPTPVLFCIDQHAADERYRLERLLEQFATDCAGGTAAHPLSAVLTLGISVQQYELIDGSAAVQSGLQILGWSVKELVLVHATLGHAQVDIDGIPHILKDKALTDRGRIKDRDLLQSSFANCLGELASAISTLSKLSTEGNTDWLSISSAIPTSLMDVIKSTACRSAIMFNDPLSREASERLVRRLGECKFPFQCAHGRPSLVPLCEVRFVRKVAGDG